MNVLSVGTPFYLYRGALLLNHRYRQSRRFLFYLRDPLENSARDTGLITGDSACCVGKTCEVNAVIKDIPAPKQYEKQLYKHRQLIMKLSLYTIRCTRKTVTFGELEHNNGVFIDNRIHPIV